MTTAHRPTYNPSRGNNSFLINPSLQFSSRDLPSNTQIKYREDLNAKKSIEEMKRELHKREREGEENANELGEFEDPVKKRKTDEEPTEPKESPSEGEIENLSEVNPFEEDKDYEFSEGEESEVDTEEELLIELEKIKKAHEEEKKKKEEEFKEKKDLELLHANPLLNIDNGEYSLKKRWYEDTIFKNQTKNEQKPQKRFINDTVRSDFHRKFLSKTIQ